MKYCNIPIFVPHYGCPFDCVFCNQKHITGEKDSVDAKRTKQIITEHLETLRNKEKRVEAAFFGGSFTAICPDLQEELLSAAYEFVKAGEIGGIRLSTRPDYIDDEIMQRLMRYGVTAVELGVQSMDNGVLKAAGRGHTDADVVRAVEVIKKYPVELGLQMMTGLPGDDGSQSVLTAERIIALKPRSVRIYPTLVIRDTALCRLYERGEYKPQTLEEAVKLAAELLEKFRENNIDVIRVGLAATEEISPGGALVAGPYHAAFGELAEGEIYYNKMRRMLNGARYAEFGVNPSEISKAIGNAKRNIKRFEKAGVSVKLVQDAGIPKGSITLRSVEG